MSKNNDLIITRRQASFLSAALLLLFVSFFIFGYIIGQRKALNEFNEILHNESFADRVRYSLYSSYGNSPVSEETADSEIELDLSDDQSDTKFVSDKTYYAPLYGCGSLKTAQAFVDRVRRLGFETFIKDRKSRGAKGKVIQWYQVVTKNYNNKEELQKVVDKIQAAEKLQQVKIVEV
ncbi:hypothetical protein A3F66_05035 [candidate division TM6 bacterium RIFCSPHIGHO2_12_FULL_32_22]|nr:MAG: hypothetical protein A3F66_05035 [candidate division TM6 bacterium RIFCSPHIGHO2_12_FULL_32_22]